MKYRKPGIRPFEITGEVERLNAINNCVYILTHSPHERRQRTRIQMEEAQVKQFIPYLYKIVNVKFIKGCVFISCDEEKEVNELQSLNNGYGR
jgi:hypothetical protein